MINQNTDITNYERELFKNTTDVNVSDEIQRAIISNDENHPAIVRTGGIFEVSQVTVAISSTGLKSNTFTVPVNEKWILKGVHIEDDGTGVCTTTGEALYISRGSNSQVRFHDDTKNLNANPYYYVIPTEIVLNPGDRVKLQAYVSVKTSNTNYIFSLSYHKMRIY